MARFLADAQKAVREVRPDGVVFLNAGSWHPDGWRVARDIEKTGPYQNFNGAEAFFHHGTASSRYECLMTGKYLRAEQIHRLAGTGTFAPPTNLRWSMARPDGLQALARRGVRCLSGYFLKDKGGWDINYGLDDRRSEYLSQHDLLMDFETGISFFRDAIICNSRVPDQIAPTLDPLAAGPERRETINLLCHEQYFWPFYTDYEPDYAQRIEAAIRWTTDHGYKPCFFHEGILGSPES